ncbi:MAG: hypothetical protein ABI024_04225 [Vicinamibacterales bacterium]
MQVKMRTVVSGLRDGQPWPAIGAVIDLPDDEAVSLLYHGIAVPVYDPESGVENSMYAPGEELRDVTVGPYGALDTSARDALVPTKRTRQRTVRTP